MAELSRSAYVTIKIYDFSGMLVTTVAEDEETHASDRVDSFKWDGTTRSGERVADGVYFCRIVAKSKAGHEAKSEIIRIALVRD